MGALNELVRGWNYPGPHHRTILWRFVVNELNDMLNRILTVNERLTVEVEEETDDE